MARATGGYVKLKFQHDALLGAFERLIRQRIDSETQSLASGRCADFVDYNVRVARIAAWHLALEDLGAAVKTYLEEDDDDD